MPNWCYNRITIYGDEKTEAKLKEIEKIFDDACAEMERERKWAEEQELQERKDEENLAKSLGIDVPTLQRWMKEAA